MQINYKNLETYSNLINEWKLISGEDIKINDNITIKHPTVKEILETEEENYYQQISSFITAPHDHLVSLWDMGILYTEITNWELFIKLFAYEIEPTSPRYKIYKNIIGDYNFSLYKKNTNEFVFYCKEYDFMIDELIYVKISTYLKYINNIPFKNDINPPEDKRYAKALISEMVNHERYKQNQYKNRSRKKRNYILHYVNKLVWGTHKTYQEVLNMKLYQFRMGIETLNSIKNYEEIKLGYYTGNLDTKKVRMQDYDWLNK